MISASVKSGPTPAGHLWIRLQVIVDEQVAFEKVGFETAGFYIGHRPLEWIGSKIERLLHLTNRLLRRSFLLLNSRLGLSYPDWRLIAIEVAGYSSCREVKHNKSQRHGLTDVNFRERYKNGKRRRMA